MGQPDTVQQALRPRRRIPRGPAIGQLRQHDILGGAEFGQQVVELEYEADVPVAEPRQGPIFQRQDVGTGDAQLATGRPVERAWWANLRADSALYVLERTSE